MSYQGSPPSGPGYGYDYDYGPPGPYQQQPPQQHQHQHFVPAPQPLPSWDGSPQGMNMPQAEQMNQMNQIQQMRQAYSQNAYYQQPQYASMNGPSATSPYMQIPVHLHHQYQQYTNQPQQHPITYDQPPPPQLQAPTVQQIQPLPISQQPSQRRDPPKSTTIMSVEIPQYRDQPRGQVKTSPSSRSEGKPVDKQMLLITLAEEHFAAAHKLGPSVGRIMSQGFVEEYQSLVATGLGCLEAAFKKTKLAPRLEARVRLRYASVLYEETENYMEAETALSQGIILCDQNRYLDLKYSMQVLMAQLVFMKNPKASLKSLERHCADTEAYRHHSWSYVFRFIRASLSLKLNKISDSQTAIHELRHVSSVANGRGDRSIYLLSSLMEVLAHLSSPIPESAEQAQTALAAAWTYQLEEHSKIPQLIVLTHILDLTCSMIYGRPSQTEAKQKEMEAAFKDSEWSAAADSSDLFAVPINTAQNQAQLVSSDTRGILGISEDGRHTLMVSFLNNNDAFALMRLLSGIALLHNNCMDGKAAQYLKQGLQSVDDSNKSRKATGSLPRTIAKSQWRDVLSCYLHLYIVFCYALSSDWKAARDRLDVLDKSISGLDEVSVGPLAHFYIYLSGICYQATGDLREAAKKFNDPMLQLSDNILPSNRLEEQVQQELALLASLNTLWLRQTDPSQDKSENAAMIAKLEPLCANHRNKDIETALKLVKATVKTEPATSGVKIKTYLASALDAARATSNKQFLCITLSVMCAKFFVGVVGVQADKAAKAAAHQAKRARNTLWMSVTHGMLANNLELQGNHGEAKAANEEAKRLAALVFPGPS